MLTRYDISWDKENAQHIKLSQLRGPQPAIQTICKVLLQRTDKTTDRLLTLFISPKHADRKILWQIQQIRIFDYIFTTKKHINN